MPRLTSARHLQCREAHNHGTAGHRAPATADPHRVTGLNQLRKPDDGSITGWLTAP